MISWAWGPSCLQSTTSTSESQNEAQSILAAVRASRHWSLGLILWDNTSIASFSRSSRKGQLRAAAPSSYQSAFIFVLWNNYLVLRTSDPTFIEWAVVWERHSRGWRIPRNRGPTHPYSFNDGICHRKPVLWRALCSSCLLVLTWRWWGLLGSRRFSWTCIGSLLPDMRFSLPVYSRKGPRKRHWARGSRGWVEKSKFSRLIYIVATYRCSVEDEDVHGS